MRTSRNGGEHDDAWSPVVEHLQPSGHLASAWSRGLGFNRTAPSDVLIGILDTGTAGFLLRDDLPPSVMDAAASHPLTSVWSTAVDTGKLSPAQWDRVLTTTAALPVHTLLVDMAAEQAAHRCTEGRTGVEPAPRPGALPPATPAETAAMASTVPDITPDHRTYALWWVAALHDDADAMRLLAGSPNLWIRRSVARAVRLPPDVVELLAHDEDRVVRLFLSESCDDAPADLLLNVWSWSPGSLSFPGRPRDHPNFPRRGLLRFADDPRPRMRLLALDDPASDDALVERFSHDPDAAVRARAATDPRLSPAAAARLAEDADTLVRRTAGRHPNVPPAVLTALLLDVDSAEDAARNPAIPLAVMHRMVALAVRAASRR